MKPPTVILAASTATGPWSVPEFLGNVHWCHHALQTSKPIHLAFQRAFTETSKLADSVNVVKVKPVSHKKKARLTNVSDPCAHEVSIRTAGNFESSFAYFPQMENASFEQHKTLLFPVCFVRLHSAQCLPPLGKRFSRLNNPRLHRPLAIRLWAFPPSTKSANSDQDAV